MAKYEITHKTHGTKQVVNSEELRKMARHSLVGQYKVEKIEDDTPEPEVVKTLKKKKKEEAEKKSNDTN